ncbi:hypothetical protein [Bifidobacterium sp. SO4]|uniref:hypothetical protein n=1 Tax=Bifidobacterium sp. SO4 TaxID=2809030 RepID=UPI001BDC6F43|nr:hypothetical protein [Bifidobacterium sp. SO4]MBT1171265.1 hypothetical protein [Bifidobacterium sp. SO4]
MRVTLTPLDAPLHPLILKDGSRKAFNPFDRRPSVEAVLDVDSLSDGWYSSLEPDVEDKPIPGWHGSYQPAFIRLKKRTVTLKGHRMRWLHARDASTLGDGAFKEYLCALVGRLVRLEVEDENGYRWSDGFVGAQIPFQSDMGFTTFSIILSLESFKHGYAGLFTPVGNRCRVENDGTAPSWPVVIVDNPAGLSFVNVSDGTGEVNWTGDGTATSVTLYFAGLDPQSGRMERNDVFTIPPGGMDLYVTASKGSTVTVECAPSWK